MTVLELYETLDDEQRRAVYYMLGCNIERGKDPRNTITYNRLISTLNDKQKKAMELLIDEVMKKND